jgi:hypothetical protein
LAQTWYSVELCTLTPSMASAGGTDTANVPEYTGPAKKEPLIEPLIEPLL